MRLVLATLVLLLAFAPPAGALAPGDVDRSFGVDGTAVTRFGPLVDPGASVAAARDVETLSDGKLLVAGSAPDAEGQRAVALARYRPDGRLDRSFGDGGTVVEQIGVTHSSASAVVLDPAGGLFVTGTADKSDGTTAVLVARFDADGALAWSTVDQFGAGSAAQSAGLDIARQADDRLVVVGRANQSSTDIADPLVASFEPAAGARDLSFAGTGFRIDPAPRGDAGPDCAFGSAEASAVTITGTGSIVTGGTLARTCATVSRPVALLRSYSSTGDQSAGFPAAPPGLDAITVLARGPDATVLAGGAVISGDGLLPGAARYISDGSPDGPPGDQFLPPSGFGPLEGLEAGTVVGIRPQQQTSRVLAAVDAPSGPDLVARLNADGSPDSVFATSGLAEAGITNPRALALQRDGGVVVVGDRVGLPDRDVPAFNLARLHGGTSISRVRLGGSARVRAGAARLRLTCSAGPGCEGFVTGPRIGQVAYAIAGGARDVVDVPVEAAARTAASIRVRVANTPAPAVGKSVRLG
jgi:uncharacterized delta-60 repeat protein